MCSGSWRCSRGFLAAWLPARRVRSPGASGYVVGSASLQSPATSRRGPCDGRRAPGGRAGRGRGGHTRRSYDASVNASFNGAPCGPTRTRTNTGTNRNTVSEQPRKSKSPAIDGDITLRIKCSDSRGRFYRRVPRGATRGRSGIACSRAVARSRYLLRLRALGPLGRSRCASRRVTPAHGHGDRTRRRRDRGGRPTHTHTSLGTPNAIGFDLILRLSCTVPLCTLVLCARSPRDFLSSWVFSVPHATCICTACIFGSFCTSGRRLRTQS